MKKKGDGTKGSQKENGENNISRLLASLIRLRNSLSSNYFQLVESKERRLMFRLIIIPLEGLLDWLAGWLVDEWRSDFQIAKFSGVVNGRRMRYDSK